MQGPARSRRRWHSFVPPFAASVGLLLMCVAVRRGRVATTPATPALDEALAASAGPPPTERAFVSARRGRASRADDGGDADGGAEVHLYVAPNTTSTDATAAEVRRGDAPRLRMYFVLDHLDNGHTPVMITEQED